MPIIDLQMRARELGRIRIGQVVASKNGKTRPSKLDRFRITAHSRDLIEKIAALYGGTATVWTPQGNGAPGWEVITAATRLPVLVPPQPVSQWYETWSGGGCQRRCDGVREVISDQPCLCGPDPANRECKPTTRLNVVLREVEGVGVFRLETHGYYAAVELPSAAELLAASRGYIVGFLGLEERVVKRDGETRRFMVPTLDIEATPMQLMSGAGSFAPAIDRSAPAAISGDEERPALPAGATAPTTSTPGSEKPMLTAEQEATLLDQIRDTDHLDQVREMWTSLTSTYLLLADGPVTAALKARAAELDPQTEQQAVEQMSPRQQPAAAEDPDELWSQILRAVPESWTTTEVEKDFANFTGTPAEVAGAADMRAYLDHLKKGN